MREPDVIMRRLPVVYGFAALGALIAIAGIGIWHTPLAPLANHGEAAALLRSLLALPMPLVFAIWAGCDWRSKPFWIVALVAGSAIVLNAPLFITMLLALAIVLALATLGVPLGSVPPSSISSASTVSPGTQLGWAIGLIALSAALRLSVLDEPFERDLMVYAMVARSWLEGLDLYAQAWDHKPPAIYVVYAGAIGLLGQEPLAIWALGILAFGCTLVGVKLAADRLAGPRAGLAAMAVWSVCGNDVLLQANQPNVEVFMNACLVWALVLLLPTAKHPNRPHNVLAAGLMFFLASVFKQIAVFPAVLAAVWLFWTGMTSGPEKSGTRATAALKSVAVLAIPGLIGWAVIFVAFSAAGTFDSFFYAAFSFNHSYSGSIFGNLARVVFAGVEHPYYVALFLTLFFLHWMTEKGPNRSLLLLLYVGSAIMVAAPGKHFPHYYQLLLPLLAISTGVFLTRHLPGASLVKSVLIALAPIWISFGYFTSPERLALVKYDAQDHGGAAVESREVGRWLAQNTTPETRILHWGAEPGVYFWSGRPTPYRHSYNYPLFAGPRAQTMLKAFQTDIACRPPDIVVITIDPTRAEDPIRDMLAQSYSPMPTPLRLAFFEIWSGEMDPSACPQQSE
ncbi:hypothetical protein K3727_11735 [Rhodobacteraceae bacterium M382]|nr:hypothetical protein K3727_11735 [Rhodobacteraceae bacterium M382]